MKSQLIVEEIVDIKGQPPSLNQVIIIDKKNKMIDKSSQYYEILDNNCIKYYSYLDILNLQWVKKGL